MAIKWKSQPLGRRLTAIKWKSRPLGRRLTTIKWKSRPLGLAFDGNQVEEPAFRPAFDGNQERALAPVAWDRVRIVRLPTNADSPLVSAPDQRAPDSFECIRDAAQNPHRPEFDDS